MAELLRQNRPRAGGGALSETGKPPAYLKFAPCRQVR